MSRHLIGMLTPSSNTILEPATSSLVADLTDVSAHFSRFNVTRIALGAASDNQFRQDPMLAAADLLADARVGVIGWSGTSAAWLGRDWDRALCDGILARTGTAACTSVGAINRLIEIAGASRIALISPYTDDVQERIIANYAAAGIEVVAETHAGLSENFAFSEIDDAAVLRMCRQVASSRPEAVVIMCTNMRGWSLMAQYEAETGIPLIDSTAAVVWEALVKLGVDMSALVPRGWMFGQRPQ